MPRVDIVVRSEVSRSSRVRQLEAMFDVPPGDKSELSWHGELPIEDQSWNVGLIVGPSGAGKSTVARQLFGGNYGVELAWGGASVIDDFAGKLSMQEIAEVCQAVGFNTIPAWMRPYRVLSNGERFRVEIARSLLELPSPVVIDEFTSVVDRQVAKIGSHAVQKYVRRKGMQFVAVTCHYDVIDWLQPDWIFEPATMAFTPRRSLQRRPEFACQIARVPRSYWRLFAPFHYMSASLHTAARCFGLFVEGQIAAFCGVLYRPHPKAQNIYGVSRIVTLPDWQGLGLAFVLADTLGAAYKAIGKRFRNYPAHPAYIRANGRSPKWAMVKRPGHFSPAAGRTSTLVSPAGKKIGGRPCAVFEYTGPAMDKEQAKALIFGMQEPGAA